MKDFIVFLALIVLGIVIVGLVMGFRGKAKELSDGVSNQLNSGTLFPTT